MLNVQVRPERLLEWVAALCFLFAAYVAIRYAGQAPYDLHAFRQTQTALTSYWFLQDGFRLDYETPVAGYPWSIPFEFPIYQALVAVIVKITGCRLEVAGRLLSFAFLCACVWPARRVVSKLELPRSVFLVFIALLFSSPVYLYWGRTFMMETAALFFAVAAIPFWLDMLKRPALRSALWFGVFSALAMLQKVTTEIPLLIVLGATWLWHLVRSTGTVAVLWRKQNIAAGMLGFVVPFVIGAAWVFYSDLVKTRNPLGAQLTSHALSAWNWGHLSQRFSSDLLIGALWKRLFEQNLGGFLGALGLCIGVLRLPSMSRITVALCIAAGLLPLFLFSNLYIVHKYYLAANTLALLFGLAVVSGELLRTRASLPALVAVVAIVALNLSAFVREYLPAAQTVFTARNTSEVAVGTVLQREIAPTQAFVAFGNDWSSSLAYASRRKSFTVAPFFDRYAEVEQHPQRFLGDAPLGAIVACIPGANSALSGVLQWVADNGWTMGNVRGCYIAIAPKHAEPPTAIVDAPACDGDIVGTVNTRAGEGAADLVEVLGWVSGAHGRAPDDVFVSLTDEVGTTSMKRTIRTPRSETSDAFAITIDRSRLRGASKLSIVRQTDNAFERCPWVVDLPAAPTPRP